MFGWSWVYERELHWHKILYCSLVLIKIFQTSRIVSMADRVNCEEERRELQGYQSIREYLARILMGDGIDSWRHRNSEGD